MNKKPLIIGLWITAGRYYAAMCLRIGLVGLIASVCVVSVQGQCALACNKYVPVRLDAAGATEITYDIVLEGEENPNLCAPNQPGDFRVEVLLGLNGPLLPGSPRVTEAQAGDTLFVKVSHKPSGNFCIGSVVVFGYSPLSITCPPATIVDCRLARDTASSGSPLVSGEGNYELTWEDDILDLRSLCIPALERITRTFTAQPLGPGAAVRCSQIIDVQRADIDAVVFPPNLNGQDRPVLSCAMFSLDPEATGAAAYAGLELTADPAACGLSASFQDFVTDECGGSFSVVRTWTIRDPCLGLVRRRDQIILVRDQTPPQVTCPSEALVVYTSDPDRCTASVELPAALVEDACSAEWSVQIQIADGTRLTGNGGLLPALPVGAHLITYEAIDPCGNKGTCRRTVIVLDGAPPRLTCEAVVEVALRTSDPQGVAPEVLVREIADACCVPELQIQRSDDTTASPAALAFIDCADLGKTLIFQLTARDCAGNEARCEAAVTVTDGPAPALASCPPDRRLLCDQDPADLALTGIPEVRDACGPVDLDYRDTAILNVCGLGFITRTWTLELGDGARETCNQQIELVDTALLQLKFPPNFFSPVCLSLEDLQPSRLPAPFDRPDIRAGVCRMTASDFADTIYSDTLEVCLLIERTWTVIDWCTYQEENGVSGPGVFRQKQQLRIERTAPPEIVCPPARTVMLEETDCLASFTLAPPEAFQACAPLAGWDIQGALGTDPNVSGAAPGLYEVVYRVTDVCGNAASCSTSVAIIDGRAPRVNCVNGLAVDLDEEGRAEVAASDFILRAIDNCTPTSALRLRLGPAPETADSAILPPDSTALYTCADTGFHILSAWAGDRNGNWGYCLTFVQVKKGKYECLPDTGGIAISGRISNMNGEMLPAVGVQLAGAGSMAVETDHAGSFQFRDVPRGNEYELRPYKNNDHALGVTTFDIVLTMQHLTLNKPFSSPYQWIAADVNRSGTVSILDVVLMQRVILLKDTIFPGNTSWRFFPGTFRFPEGSQTSVPDFPESVHLDPLVTDLAGMDFTGIKTGDVNMSARLAPNGRPVEVRQGSRPLELTLADRLLEAGTEVRLPLTIAGSEEGQGFQVGLEYDPEVIEVRSMRAGQEGGYWLAHSPVPGKINASWVASGAFRWQQNRPVLELDVRMKKTGRPGQFLALQRSGMASEWYAGADYPPRAITLRFGKDETVQVHRPFPNPFYSSSELKLVLPEAGEVSLTVSDSQGKVCFRQTARMEAGEYPLRVRADQLPGPGLYWVRARAGTTIKTHPLLLLGS